MKSFNTYDNLVKLSLIDTTPSTPVIEEVQELDVSDLLLEDAQLSNAEQMYTDILNLVKDWWKDTTSSFDFYVALAKLITKAIKNIAREKVTTRFRAQAV